MAFDSNFRPLTATLISYTSAAAFEKPFVATGSFYYCEAGTDIEVTVWDNQNRKLCDTITLIPGRGFKFPPGYVGYKGTIKSAAAQAIKLRVIDGEIIDNSFIVSSLSVVLVTPSATTYASAAAATSCPQDAVTSVSAATVGARKRWIRNDHATITVWLRSNTTKAESAIEIPAGQVAIIESANELFVYNKAASGASVDVYVDSEVTT